MSHKRLLALALALPLVGALAQAVPPSSPGSVPFPVSTVRNISTFGATPVSPANVGRFAFAHAIGGNVVADAATGLPISDGRTVPVTVRSTVPKANVSAALGRFLRKGLPIVGTGVALFDLAQELGYKLEVNGGETEVKLQTKPPAGYDGKEWRPQSAFTTWYETRQAACVGHAYQRSISGYPFEPTTWVCHNAFSHAPESGTQWMQTRHKDGHSITDHILDVRVDPTPFVPTEEPSTPQALEDAIQAKNDWQPSSALARSLVDAIKAGELVQSAPESVTGPASTPGSSSTTTDAVNGTTTTTTNTFNHVYDGAKVTTTLTTTNLTINSSTGAVVSNTTTTTIPVMPETDPDDEDGTPTDTALPGQPELYEPEYPEGLKGVWNAKKAQLQDVPLLNLLEDLMPAVAGSGTCPSWSLDLDLYIADYGAHLVQVPCWIWDFGKVVIICSALLLSRRLIFGG